MPFGADGVTLVVEKSRMGEFGVIDFNGVGGQFQTVTYQQRMSFSEGKVITFRLQPGDNHLRLGYRLRRFNGRLRVRHSAPGVSIR